MKKLIAIVAVAVLGIAGFGAIALSRGGDEWHQLEGWQLCRDSGAGHEGADGYTYSCEVYNGDKPYWKRGGEQVDP